jgi:hypothetical protein
MVPHIPVRRYFLNEARVRHRLAITQLCRIAGLVETAIQMTTMACRKRLKLTRMVRMVSNRRR